MEKTIFRVSLFAIAISALVFNPARADAQMRPMMIPLPTTLIISKPAPGEIYGDKQVVTLGVSGKTYKFVLNDAYVDDPRGIIHWPDIWEMVRQYKPNFNVTGLGEETFQTMQPGQTLTVRGMFTGNNQNFEVVGTEPGAGRFGPGQHY